MTRKIIVAIILLISQSAVSQQQSATGSIEGIVFRVDSNDPIEGIKVVLSRSTSDGGTFSGTSSDSDPFVLTNKQGRFAFKEIDAGFYRLVASKNGYLPQKYGQRGSAGKGSVLKLDSGQTARDITFHLTPQANISGHIRNDNGESLEGVTVRLQRYIYTPDGRRVLNTVQTTTTNDRGEYRIYWIDPGRYYLAATGKDSFMSPSFKVGDATFTPTYFGGVVDPLQAALLNLHPGDDTPAIDVVLSQQQNHVFRIRGRVVDATGLPVRFARVAVIRRDSKGLFYGERRSSYYDTAKGTFEIGNLGPGTYWVSAQAMESGSGGDGSAYIGTSTGLMFDPGSDGNPLRSAQVRVELTSSDIEDLLMNTAAGTPITGHLTMEGQGSDAYKGIEVELRGNPAATGAAGYAPADPNGNFLVKSVSAGEYRVIVHGIPSAYYVKAARLGGDDILGQTVKVNASTKASMEIVVSLRPGRIDGIVVDDSSKPISGIQAVLIPDRQKERLDLYQTAVSDSNGRFVMASIAPGDYRIYSWEELEPYAYFDPDVVREFEPRGKVVHVIEASRENLEVRVIPALP
jgi:protocatechuate 3,4-dioxygenase beta subunit